MPQNIDRKVVSDFGKEWSRFDQSDVPRKELAEAFLQYFAVFPWKNLPRDPRGFDLGCGSGRWAQFVAPRVAELHCIDPSAEALRVAKRTLDGFASCRFHLAGVDSIPLDDNSMDFGYSLGVLHHVPDTGGGIRSCVAKLKPGAPFLLYLYYAFDNKPLWFRLVWKASDILRRMVSRAPYWIKYATSQLIALAIYLPLAQVASFVERSGRNVEHYPLSVYRTKSFYTMRTDALDRFGTRLEKRFTRKDIERMMVDAGLFDIEFSDKPPYWCVLGLAQK